MKKIIQLILLFVLFLFSIIFYKSFFQENNQVNEDLRKQEDQNLSNKQNNLIKNLRYDVKFDNNTQYTISSELNELTYENEIEIVKMQKVSAIFIGSNNIPLIISSDKAIYNNSTYNTNFIDNVIVEYLDHTIKSEKLDMNFTKNIVLISDNVVYEGSEGLVNTDNIIINLESKNAKVFMNRQKDKVEVTSK